MRRNEWAKRAGIHLVSISRILNGHIEPTLDTCERLASTIGVPLGTLFGEPKHAFGGR